jgi:undecaprenyl-diphosphatase
MNEDLGQHSRLRADRGHRDFGNMDTASVELAGDGTDALVLGETRGIGARARIAVLLRIELELVRYLAWMGQSAWIRPFALTLNYLGNGWLYPILAVALLSFFPEHFASLVVSIAVAAASAQAVYPWIKRRVARPRPFEVDPSLVPMLPAMDRYSFPSGHCMTITAVVVPMCWILPTLALPALLICALIAWARIAAAHHYPSDIAGGFALGVVAALPVIWFLP